MKLTTYQADAFTDEVFKACNPSSISDCVKDENSQP